MTNMKIEEQTSLYTIYSAKYKGTTQLFRRWATSDIIDMKFTDDFARANGYKNRADMLRKEPEVRKSIQLAGGMPEWIQIVNGKFYVKIATMN